MWLNETLEYNTIADSNLRDYEGLDKWFMPEVSFKLNILPVQGLTFNQTLGYELRQWEEHTYTYKTSRGEIENARKGTAYLGFSKTENINAEGYGSYIRSWDKHNLNAMVGYSYYEGNGESFNMTNYDFSVEGVKYWDIGTGTYLKKGLASMGSSKNVTTKLFSYFGRVNYDYDNRYLLSASLRRESSSKFMKNNRWGTFWSVSGGWRISDEKFMENASWVSDLKIRAAYGVTGNSSFSTSYGALAYGSDGYFMMPNTGNYNIVYGPSINLNEDLKWEEQHGWNIGIDYSFFDDRLYGKFDWYNRKVVDMLYSVKVPQPPYPNTDMMKNIGSMTNRGWEFEIGADIVRSKDWSYTTNIILSHDKTKITTLYGDSTFFEDSGFPAPGSPGNAKRVEEGTTIGQFYLLKGAGIDTERRFPRLQQGRRDHPVEELDLGRQAVYGQLRSQGDRVVEPPREVPQLGSGHRHPQLDRLRRVQHSGHVLRSDQSGRYQPAQERLRPKQGYQGREETLRLFPRGRHLREDRRHQPRLHAASVGQDQQLHKEPARVCQHQQSVHHNGLQGNGSRG